MLGRQGVGWTWRASRCEWRSCPQEGLQLIPLLARCPAQRPSRQAHLPGSTCVDEESGSLWGSDMHLKACTQRLCTPHRQARGFGVAGFRGSPEADLSRLRVDSTSAVSSRSCARAASACALASEASLSAAPAPRSSSPRSRSRRPVSACSSPAQAGCHR